jgi:hypothetical protein
MRNSDPQVEHEVSDDLSGGGMAVFPDPEKGGKLTASVHKSWQHFVKSLPPVYPFG